jgi:hypothetical protein
MKRSINFSSIFRREEDQLPPPSSDQTDHVALAERIRERSIKLHRGELEPVSSASSPLDWEAVDGQIIIQGAAIEGMLEGRARIRAAHLKGLSPSPVTADTPDPSEYVVSLQALIPQIHDLLGAGEPEPPEAEYETPFTILAKQDGARFAAQGDGQKKLEPRKQLTSALFPPDPDGSAPSEETLSGQVPGLEEKEQQEPEQVAGSDNAGPPVIALRKVRPASPRQTNRTELPENPLDGEDDTMQHQVRKNDPPALPEHEKIARIQQVETRAKEEEPFFGDPAVTTPVSRRWDGDPSPAGRGMGRLQEIFMTSEPLDARRVASLVRQFPGVTGALILLQGGAVLGGQLPESLNMDAALQAPEVLAKFLRFILELEGASVAPRFITVTSTSIISLVSCGQVVLLVSHQGRKLPPGLAQRLTETAQALDLVYGKN